ncbi:hypothetical protein FKM82_028546 [Ascaphus truei]
MFEGEWKCSRLEGEEEINSDGDTLLRQWKKSQGKQVESWKQSRIGGRRGNVLVYGFNLFLKNSQQKS